jgi:hypothetical protein
MPDDFRGRHKGQEEISARLPRGIIIFAPFLQKTDYFVQDSFRRDVFSDGI